MVAAFSGNAASNEVAVNAGTSEHETSSDDQIQPAPGDEVLPVAADNLNEEKRRDDAQSKLQAYVERAFPMALSSLAFH